MFCSNEELQSYMASDGNKIIWSIIQHYAKGLDADDVYQECLIAVCKALATYDEDWPGTKKGTYVYQVVYNRVKMLIRHNTTCKRSFEREASSANEQLTLYIPSVSLEEEIIERVYEEDRGKALWYAIGSAGLTKDERSVILLTLDEVKQCDIGHQLGASQGQVSKLKKSAMWKIKKFLEEYGWSSQQDCEYIPFVAF